MKKAIRPLMAIVIFLLGLTIFLYPTVSNLYNEHKNSLLIDNYVDTFSDTDDLDSEKILEDARKYNKYFHDEEKLKELGLSYESCLNTYGNGIMGYIEIPKISVRLVIYHTVDDSVLQNAIGHVKESSLPVGGSSTHCVLAGHRGLPSAKLLTNIDQLVPGDSFYINLLGEKLEYRVDDISVVLPDETSKLKIENGKDYVTLVTCTPYGVNSHRLLVRGERVENNKTAYNGSVLNVSDDILNINPIYVVPIGLVVLFILANLINLVLKKKKNKTKKESSNDEAK